MYTKLLNLAHNYYLQHYSEVTHYAVTSKCSTDVISGVKRSRQYSLLILKVILFSICLYIFLLRGYQNFLHVFF